MKDRVAEVLASVGLRPQQANLYPHEFSGGQRQRIAVASALVSKPKLIILDEPVSALDVSIRAQIMNLLVDLQQQYDVSYLLIAHHLATTRYMANEVAVMYLGKIVEKATTKELFAKPLHPYTKALFSAALPSHPDITHDEIILTGEVPSPINPPSGCRFHPRCPFAMPKCSSEVPQLREVAPGHQVSCHLVYLKRCERTFNARAPDASTPAAAACRQIEPCAHGRIVGVQSDAVAHGRQVARPFPGDGGAQRVVVRLRRLGVLPRAAPSRPACAPGIGEHHPAHRHLGHQQHEGREEERPPDLRERARRLRRGRGHGAQAGAGKREQASARDAGDVAQQPSIHAQVQVLRGVRNRQPEGPGTHLHLRRRARLRVM